MVDARGAVGQRRGDRVRPDREPAQQAPRTDRSAARANWPVTSRPFRLTGHGRRIGARRQVDRCERLAARDQVGPGREHVDLQDPARTPPVALPTPRRTITAARAARTVTTLLAVHDASRIWVVERPAALSPVVDLETALYQAGTRAVKWGTVPYQACSLAPGRIAARAGDPGDPGESAPRAPSARVIRHSSTPSAPVALRSRNARANCHSPRAEVEWQNTRAILSADGAQRARWHRSSPAASIRSPASTATAAAAPAPAISAATRSAPWSRRSSSSIQQSVGNDLSTPMPEYQFPGPDARRPLVRHHPRLAARARGGRRRLRGAGGDPRARARARAARRAQGVRGRRARPTRARSTPRAP